MATNFRRSAAPLIATIQKLSSKELANENDFLRQENEILRSRLGKPVPLTEADRRTLVRYGLPHPAKVILNDLSHSETAGHGG